MPIESCLLKTMAQGARLRASRGFADAPPSDKGKKMKHRKVTRIDSLSPATHDLQYYGRVQHDIHFDITDAFNTIVVLAFLALLILYPTLL
jgi:hypothetical protein